MFRFNTQGTAEGSDIAHSHSPLKWKVSVFLAIFSIFLTLLIGFLFVKEYYFIQDADHAQQRERLAIIRQLLQETINKTRDIVNVVNNNRLVFTSVVQQDQRESVEFIEPFVRLKLVDELIIYDLDHKIFATASDDGDYDVLDEMHAFFKDVDFPEEGRSAVRLYKGKYLLFTVAKMYALGDQVGYTLAGIYLSQKFISELAENSEVGLILRGVSETKDPIKVPITDSIDQKKIEIPVNIKDLFYDDPKIELNMLWWMLNVQTNVMFKFVLNIFGVVVCCALFILISYKFFNGISRRIEAITHWAQAVASGKDHVEFQEQSGNDELSELSRHINLMRDGIVHVSRLEKMIDQRTEQLERTIDELKEAKEKAEEASRLKNEFIANVSHEIRTPMNSVLGALEMLLLSHLTKEQNEYATISHQSGVQLLNLLNDILNFAKFESGKMDFEQIPFSLNNQLKLIMTQFKLTAEKKGLNFILEYAPKATHELVGDPLRLNQVFTNLIANAIKFTDTGGTVKVQVMVEPKGDQKVSITARVSDTGIGIPMGVQEKIFSSFTQVDGSITRRYGGTGLGLSISKHIIEFWGGQLTVHSNINEGSTFEFQLILPLSQNLDSDFQERSSSVQNFGEADRKILGVGEIKTPEEKPGHSQPLCNRKILLVEDHHPNQMVCTAMLNKLGYQAEVVEDGQQALQAVSEKTFDLILMDCQMPIMDGLTATRKIRAWEQSLNKQSTPIVALTANMFNHELEACRKAGMDDILGKPFNLAALSSILAKYL